MTIAILVVSTKMNLFLIEFPADPFVNCKIMYHKIEYTIIPNDKLFQDSFNYTPSPLLVTNRVPGF